MIALKSYTCGRWKAPEGDGRLLRHAVTGEAMATVSSRGVDFAATVDYGRRRGGPALRALSFPQRAELLKSAADVLKGHRDELYSIASTYGATRDDAVMDVDGGIAALGYYGRLGSKKLPDTTYLVDGELARLSKEGHFGGRHILVPLEGVVVQINAYNFPAWAMLEKLAPSLLAGMPNIVKPATPSAWLAFRIVEILVGAGTLPEGSLQLICGSVGDLLDHLTCQDVVAFTGSAETGRKVRSHPNLVATSVRVNIEADSLNCIVLGPDVRPATALFERFIEEVVREMRVKAGQKCTAIRRVLVPRQWESAVVETLVEKLSALKVGDPSVQGIQMGPLVEPDAVASAREGIDRLKAEAEIVYGDPRRAEFEGVGNGKGGAFMEPVLLRCLEPEKARLVHEVEVFGPLATLIAYKDTEQAIRLARRGGGSLVGSIFSDDADFATQAALGLAPFHGRLMVINNAAAAESTGHGVVMPQLIHGGPGRAGGGEELGGVRSLYRYLQRVALQGDPGWLASVCSPAETN